MGEDRVTAQALAQLRHLYTLMLRGDVTDCAEAARGLLGPSIEAIENAERQRTESPNADYSTALVVLAKDGTYRDVAVCAGDTAEAIGQQVIAAINGARPCQLSTLKCSECGAYAAPTYAWPSRTWLASFTWGEPLNKPALLAPEPAEPSGMHDDECPVGAFSATIAPSKPEGT